MGALPKPTSARLGRPATHTLARRRCTHLVSHVGNKVAAQWKGRPCRRGLRTEHCCARNWQAPPALARLLATLVAYRTPTRRRGRCGRCSRHGGRGASGVRCGAAKHAREHRLGNAARRRGPALPQLRARAYAPQQRALSGTQSEYFVCTLCTIVHGGIGRNTHARARAVCRSRATVCAAERSAVTRVCARVGWVGGWGRWCWVGRGGGREGRAQCAHTREAARSTPSRTSWC